MADVKWTLNNVPPELGDEFVAAMARQRKSYAETRHNIEDADYAQFVLRALAGLEARAINNPALLPLTVEIEKRAREITNTAIVVNATRYRVDRFNGASMAECAAVLKISGPAASERVRWGIPKVIARVEASGVRLMGLEKVRRSEAARERELVQQATASTVVALAGWRERRAA